MILPDAPVMRATDLVDMLRRHYLPESRPAGGIFAAEIESPDGRRRADALWCPWTIAGGSGLIGHEVKVSRSDVLAELADPTKADPWARYCRQWWLVVAHPALVEGLSVPEAWGVMSPPSGRRRRTMTVLRQAPPLKPGDTGPGWRRVAAWYDFRVSQQLRDALYEAARHKATAERLESELTDRRLAEGGRLDQRAALIGQIVAALAAEPGWYHQAFEVDAVVAAITDLDGCRRLAKRTRDEIRWLADEARRFAAPMAHVAEDLDRLAKNGAPV